MASNNYPPAPATSNSDSVLCRTTSSTPDTGVLFQSSMTDPRLVVGPRSSESGPRTQVDAENELKAKNPPVQMGKLFSARAKIERAKQHIADLDLARRVFLQTNPYRVGTKRDPDTRKLIYYVTSVIDAPVSMQLLVGDAIQNLGSALDHLALQMFHASPIVAKPGASRHVYFPIGQDAAKYMAHAFRTIQGMRPDFVKIIDAVEPYKGGKGHQLWMLQELNNADKHRLLVTVGSMFRSVDIGRFMTRHLRRHMLANVPPDLPAHIREVWGTMPDAQAFLRPADPMCPLKAGDELFIDFPDAEVDEQMQFRFDVALGEPQVPKGQPLLETVHELAHLVDGIVAQLAPLF